VIAKCEDYTCPLIDGNIHVTFCHSDMPNRRQKPDDVAKRYIIEGTDQDGFELRFIDEFIGQYS
jgi:hypothetical protein